MKTALLAPVISILTLTAMPFLAADAPGVLVSDGLDRFESDREVWVAGEAYDRSAEMLDRPLDRIWFRARRVERVEEAPGHCPDQAMRGREPIQQYRAQVRLYGWFGVPSGTLYMECGAMSASFEPFEAREG